MSTAAYAKRHRELGLCRTCPKPLAVDNKNFCIYHKEKDRISRSNTEKHIAFRLKSECINRYGGKCTCCGEIILDFLTLEHLNGHGNKHRIALFKYNVGGVHMYRWLKKNNFPAEYTVLCMNCNWATRYGSNCPHKMER